MAKQTIPMQLPFPPKQVWQVTQGNNGTISHEGIAAFCWDFALPVGDSKGQPVYALAAGEVVDVRIGYFYVKHANEEFCVYMHCIPESVLVKVGDRIQMGQQIAKVGDTTGDPNKKIGAHLHVALSNVVGLPEAEDGGVSVSVFQTLPAQFMDYEVYSEATKSWEYVPSGVPQEWQKIRRASCWSAWIPHGGKFPALARPSVISRKPTVTDIVMRGMDNRLWQKSFVGGANPPWSGWMPHNDGFQLGSDPVIDSMAPDHLHVFALGKDLQLWQKWWLEGKGWSAWIPHGGKFPALARPGVISRKPTVTDIVMRGMDNKLWGLSYVANSNPSWSGWMEHNDGLELGSDPVIDTMAPDHLHVFALSKDLQLWQKWWLEGKGWSAWTPHGGKFPAMAQPSAISRKPTVTDIVMRGMDQRLWQKSFVGGANPPWSGWMPHNDGFDLGSDPVIDSMAPNHLHVFAVGTDRQLWQKWWVPE